MGAKLFGALVRRKEDARFLRSDGRYVDDIKLPGQAGAPSRSRFMHGWPPWSLPSSRRRVFLARADSSGRTR